MRALMDRRAYLMHLARLTPLPSRDVREFAALTWSLRLFRTLYDDAGTLKGDLTYRLPRPQDGEPAELDAHEPTRPDEPTRLEEDPEP